MCRQKLLVNLGIAIAAVSLELGVNSLAQVQTQRINISEIIPGHQCTKARIDSNQ